LYNNRTGGEHDDHMRNNFRPTKPLYGRTVYRSYEGAGLLSMFFPRYTDNRTAGDGTAL